MSAALANPFHAVDAFVSLEITAARLLLIVQQQSIHDRLSWLSIVYRLHVKQLYIMLYALHFVLADNKAVSRRQVCGVDNE